MYAVCGVAIATPPTPKSSVHQFGGQARHLHSVFIMQSECMNNSALYLAVDMCRICVEVQRNGQVSEMPAKTFIDRRIMMRRTNSLRCGE